MDQITCIKFCVKNEIVYATIFEMLTVVFGESTMSRTQVQLYNRFKEGREDVNDGARCSVKCEGFAHCFLRLQWRGVSFLSQGRMVNKEHYLEVMRRLRKAICQKRTEL